MLTKSYKVRFYQGSSASATISVSDVFSKLAEYKKTHNNPPIIDLSGSKYELRDFVDINNGNVFKGVLAILRDDAPNIRQAQGSESTLKLDDGDSIIEKNYFLYFKEKQLLVWQVNGRASHVSRLGNYLGTSAGFSISFNDILSYDSITKLDSGKVRQLEFTIARPRNKNLFEADDWTESAIGVMSDAGATVMTSKLSIRGQGKGLSENLKNSIRHLLGLDEIRKLKVKLSDEVEPIDLLGDRISETAIVEMNGLYPISDKMYSELDKAKGRQQDNLNKIFGSLENEILD